MAFSSTSDHSKNEGIYLSITLMTEKYGSSELRRQLFQLDLAFGTHRVLFQDRVDIWQEIEAKVNSDDEGPVVKTSNKVGDLCLSISKSNQHQAVWVFFSSCEHLYFRKSRLS